MIGIGEILAILNRKMIRGLSISTLHLRLLLESRFLSKVEKGSCSAEGSFTYPCTAATIVAPLIKLEMKRAKLLVLRPPIKRSIHVAFHQTTSPISTARKTRRLYHLMRIPTVKSWNNKTSSIRHPYVSVLASFPALCSPLSHSRPKCTRGQPARTIALTNRPSPSLTTSTATLIPNIPTEIIPCKILMPPRSLEIEGI